MTLIAVRRQSRESVDELAESAIESASQSMAVSEMMQIVSAMLPLFKYTLQNELADLGYG
jgi:hypothetical protein